jgi:hypothetical protein
VGQGSSISVDSTMAPREKWAKEDAIRASSGGSAPAAKKDPFEF